MVSKVLAQRSGGSEDEAPAPYNVSNPSPCCYLHLISARI